MKISTKGSKEVTVEDFRIFMLDHCFCFQREEINLLFPRFDKNRFGVITFKEFKDEFIARTSLLKPSE